MEHTGRAIILFLLVNFCFLYHPLDNHAQSVHLNYLNDVKVSEIVKIINVNKFVLYEKNQPKKTTISGTDFDFFENFYQKKVDGYEIDISMSGLKNKLGSINVAVRDFNFNKNTMKMHKLFNDTLKLLPKNLFPSIAKENDYANFFTTNLKPIRPKVLFMQTINGIDYRLIITDIEISIDIAKQGN